MALQSNAVSHWLGANLESALSYDMFYQNAILHIVQQWHLQDMECFFSLLEKNDHEETEM